ncbi:3'-5' exonuclease [Erwinia aphidicola]|uniref:3'-5' exonuclease n=1 Tax=Erwinia aphidicola TaxID=68334 RepID=UPI003CF37141
MSKTIASCRARHWLRRGFVILDTETTGMGEDAEIIEIAALGCDGEVILNTLVKPINPIPVEATAIHGITNEMVAGAPSWPEVIGQLILAVGEMDYLAYNSDYDSRLIRQTTLMHYHDIANLFRPFIEGHDCVMRLYAMYRGEAGKGSGYKWHKLVNAAKHEGVVIDSPAHRALADCRMTLGIINAMAKGGAE